MEMIPGTSESIPRIPRIRNYDTQGRGKISESFRDAAVERIYDEFRFLDESYESSPSSSRPIIQSYPSNQFNSIFRSKLSRWTYSFIPLSQLLVSISILVFSIFRMYRLSQNRQISNILLDLEKPEDYAQTAEEGTEIIRTRLGASCILASCMNIIASITGFWPFCTRKQNPIRILHIFFSSFSILLWFEALVTASLEINLTFIQLEDGINDSSNLSIWTSLLVLSSIQLLIIPSISLSLSCPHLIPLTIHSSPFSFLFALSSCIFSSAALSLSAYAASSTTKSTNEWPPLREIVNQGALYSFGVNECIVCSYALLLSIISLFSPLFSSFHFISSSLPILIPLSSLSISIHLLSPTRLLSLTHAVLILSPIQSSSPISSILISSLYGSLFALLLSQFIQFTLFISSILSTNKSTIIPIVIPSPQFT